MLNKSNTESDMPEPRRDSSIKRILSNQPLEKAEYIGKLINFCVLLKKIYLLIEINQKVQNTTTSVPKIHTNNDQTTLERSNSTSGR